MADKRFTCVTCGQEFVWETGEQDFFRTKGLQPPKNCPACRRAKHEGAAPTARARTATPAPARPQTAAPRRPAPRPLSRQHASPKRSFGIVTLIIAALATGALILGAGLPPPLAWALGVSAVTFFVYGYDKAVAGAGPTRVPEIVLLGLALIGGTLGAMLGMLVFRHKTGDKTADFRGGLVVVVVIQVVAAVAWLWLTQR